MKLSKINKVILVLVIVPVLLSCEALKTSAYDQYTYQQAVEIKVDASKLMEQSIRPYSKHSKAVEELMTNVEKIILYEENKSNNGISIEMWKILANEDKNLLAGYMKKWQSEGKLAQVFVDEAKPEIELAMDLIVQYEGKKDKESKSKLLNLMLKN